MEVQTLQNSEENLGRTLDDINCINILYDPHPRAMKIKTKISKWNLIKLKRFCTAKDIINKMKRQPSEWEKIFANKATDKGLTPKNKPLKIISSCSSILKKKKTNQKIGRRPEQTFLQRRHTDGQQIYESMHSSVQSLSRVRLFVTP